MQIIFVHSKNEETPVTVSHRMYVCLSVHKVCILEQNEQRSTHCLSCVLLVGLFRSKQTLTKMYVISNRSLYTLGFWIDPDQLRTCRSISTHINRPKNTLDLDPNNSFQNDKFRPSKLFLLVKGTNSDHLNLSLIPKRQI